MLSKFGLYGGNIPFGSRFRNLDVIHIIPILQFLGIKYYHLSSTICFLLRTSRWSAENLNNLVEIDKIAIWDLVEIDKMIIKNLVGP